jgi:hypothetical protein
MCLFFAEHARHQHGDMWTEISLFVFGRATNLKNGCGFFFLLISNKHKQQINLNLNQNENGQVWHCINILIALRFILPQSVQK